MFERNDPHAQAAWDKGGSEVVYHGTMEESPGPFNTVWNCTLTVRTTGDGQLVAQRTGSWTNYGAIGRPANQFDRFPADPKQLEPRCSFMTDAQIAAWRQEYSSN